MTTHSDTLDATIVGRAIAPGIAFAIVGCGAVVVSGVLPEGTVTFVTVGTAAAAMTGALGAMFKARAVAGSGAGPTASQRLQIAILGDFLLQLFTVGVTMLVMFLADVKFVHLGGFALAFAAVALGHQVGAALVLARALARRAEQLRVADSSAPDPKDADPSTPDLPADANHELSRAPR